MARKRRLPKRYRRNPETSSRSNPPLMTDLAEFIGPGFASFAATRLLTRIAATQLAKRKPSWGKHAGAITSIAAFAAAWFGAHRVKWLERYHTPIVVGAAIAALQSVIQLYVPKLGWMISDATPQIDDEAASLAIDAPAQARLIPGIEYLDEDPNEYTNNDSFDPGVTKAGAPANRPSTDDEIIADLNMEDDDMSELHLGSLGR